MHLNIVGRSQVLFVCDCVFVCGRGCLQNKNINNIKIKLTFKKLLTKCDNSSLNVTLINETNN